ncbi:hypothetical protein K7V76_000676 [Vibrio fluvialis]|nr:hypothetical protein [Vibrio fluvialis]EKO3527245.1 hypothetical protein [Vibrio fluvialis]ELE8117813.1 hypothetical protein [Vibrio fluvialis]ELL4666604.1 hypothetical protein [Vibrio fluvialis]
MFDNFLSDFTLKDAANVWLQSEQIKRVGDATGQSQNEVYNTPETSQQVNGTVTPTTANMGLSKPVLIGAGVVAAVLLVLLVRK